MTTARSSPDLIDPDIRPRPGSAACFGSIRRGITVRATLVNGILRALQPDEKLIPGLSDSGYHRTAEFRELVTAKLLTELLDPTQEPMHSLTGSTRNLNTLATNHHVLAFDDTGKLSPENVANSP